MNHCRRSHFELHSLTDSQDNLLMSTNCESHCLRIYISSPKIPSVYSLPIALLLCGLNSHHRTTRLSYIQGLPSHSLYPYQPNHSTPKMSFKPTPRSSSLPTASTAPSLKSRSTSHLPIPRKKCIYLLSTYPCLHFVQPFNNPTNIIHTSTCIARYGGLCSSDGYRYEFLSNGGGVCEGCRERGSEEEMRVEVGIEKGIREIVEGDEDKMEEGRESMDTVILNDVTQTTARTESQKNLTTTEFLVRENRSVPDLNIDRTSLNRRSLRMTTYDNQRAAQTQRPAIGEGRRVSVIIEEGWEHNGSNCGFLNSRCLVSQGRKRWEDLWGRLKKF